MKKLILGSLLLLTSSVSVGSFKSVYNNITDHVAYRRGTYGFVVGAVGTAAIGYIFREPIEQYVEPVIEKAVDTVWSVIKWPFKKLFG